MCQKWTLLKKWDDVVKGSPEIQQLPERSMKMNILNISDKIAITNEKMTATATTTYQPPAHLSPLFTRFPACQNSILSVNRSFER